jgi:hypothetical protein
MVDEPRAAEGPEWAGDAVAVELRGRRIRRRDQL